MENLNKLKVLNEHILFKFLEDVTAGTKGFTNVTSWGFSTVNHTDNASLPRWAKVINVGVNVPSTVKKDSYILIEPLMWTLGFKSDADESFWATSYSKVIAISDEEPQGIY